MLRKNKEFPLDEKNSMKKIKRSEIDSEKEQSKSARGQLLYKECKSHSVSAKFTTLQKINKLLMEKFHSAEWDKKLNCNF